MSRSTNRKSGGKGVNLDKLNKTEKRVLRTALRTLLNDKTVREAQPSATSASEAGFRRLTSKSDKELAPATWQKQMAVAHFLWQQNPMAYRVLELMADYVVGDGCTWEAEDDGLREIIDRHWNDPDNAWDLLQFDRYVETILFGTMLLKPFVNPFNGHVKLSPVDPGWIDDVVPHPEIAGRVSAVKIRRRTVDQGQSTRLETWKVIGYETDPKNPATGRLMGDVFYFSVNKLTFTHFGMSDLFRLADWLDAFDQFIFSLMERINFLNAHLYDITLQGAEQTEIKERVNDLEMHPPKPGSFRVHNEDEKWEALAPKINAAEVEQVAKIVRMLILGSMGIPEHWFAEGGDVNKATAAEMAGPILRKMKRKQAQWVTVLKTIIQFQIDQAVLKGRLTPAQAKTKWNIMPPDIAAKDVLQFVESLKKLTETLSLAIAEGFVKRAQAAGVWVAQAQELGVDIEAPDDAQVAANLQAEQGQANAQATAVEQQPYAAVAGKNGAAGKPATPAAPAAAAAPTLPAKPAVPAAGARP